MSAVSQSSERKQIYCAMCVSRCGATAVLENGHFTALEPDPEHPTGKAICAKGRAAPELVYHPDRLLYPLKRTHPKTNPDPGWQQISWEEALDTIAERLKQIAADYGPESVVFSVSSPSTSASDDSTSYISRFMNAYGTPNLCAAMELCGWGRFQASQYTYGAAVPGNYMPDLDHAGCILFWGYNPNLARLTHATATVEALKRGAKLIVVDPKQTGVARRADVWLRVRPGTDGALALGIANLMVQNGWFDSEFIRDWTNGPLLVRSDNGRFLTERDLSEAGRPQTCLGWSSPLGSPVRYNTTTGTYELPLTDLALTGEYVIETLQGPVVCRPAFALAVGVWEQYPPERVKDICGVDPELLEKAARLLWESRPAAYYAWSGVEMQSNSTQIARAIGLLYALTGSFDRQGGNVLFSSVPSANVFGWELLPQDKRTRALGVFDRPLGPSKWGFVTTAEVYRAVLEQQPYGVHGMVGIGANLLMAHADPLRGRQALQALDFYVHADLFLNPTAELADIVLPVASSFEREALKIGFEGSQAAASWVQLRQRVVDPPGEARSDMEILFGLAVRMGFGDQFWDGDINAAYRYQLSPSGINLETLRDNPGGLRVPQEPHYRRFAESVGSGQRGFNTPTRKIELYSQTMLDHGYPPLPEYEEPLISLRSRPDLAAKYPLILTCVKNTLFCETQHRELPSLRRQAMEPEVEIHPQAAAERGIQAGDWVHVSTPEGSVRAKAKFNSTLDPQVVIGQHGWWQASIEIGAPGYDPFSSEGANYNLLIGNAEIDPVSGSVPHRAYICQITQEGA